MRGKHLYGENGEDDAMLKVNVGDAQKVIKMLLDASVLRG
jgi:hypothetical protein